MEKITVESVKAFAKRSNGKFAIIVGIAVGLLTMIYDDMMGAAWEVTPRQIERAYAEGKDGVETRPGTIAGLPIRSETADILPFKWILFGIGGGWVAYAYRSKNNKPGETETKPTDAP